MDALTIRAGQFHRLVTHEDAYHAHKTLGVLCASHFSYRTILGFLHGTMFFAPTMATLVWIAIHTALHATAFQFVISNRRNRVYNIIWPEMRWHTAAFAQRSLWTMLLVWLADRGAISSAASIAARPALVIGTMVVADVATMVHGSQSTTMRGNPYPSYVPASIVKWHNMFYAISQILATMNVLVATAMDRPFLALLAIQTAPFGMTLVKKGVITQAGWHLWYTLALLANYAYALVSIETGAISTAAYAATASAVAILRFRHRVNKYVLWILASIAVQLFYFSSSAS
jgi:hypothetical protein